MNRLARRLQFAQVGRSGMRGFDPEQHYVEAALRGRTARKVRAHLRRLEPLVLTTPRWSHPQTFLEAIALDLAVGEPSVSCRTVSLRPLKGRADPEAWSFVLQILGGMGGHSGRAMVPIVAGSRGFQTVALDMLQRAQERSESPLALLAHGAENLPIGVLEDLGQIWARFMEKYPSGRRATMLLAATVDASRLALDAASKVELADFGEAEAAATLIGHTGPAPRSHLESAARFSGGIPAVVAHIGRASRERGVMPRSQAGLVRAMGPLADEMRMAVDIVNADSAQADRLQQLLSGEPLVEVPEVDRPLLLSGLLRRVRLPGEDRVLLRAPAIGAVLN